MFGRKYLLRIAVNDNLFQELDTSEITDKVSGGVMSPSTQDLLTIPPVDGVKAIGIDDLQIKATIKADKAGKNNSHTAIIEVYNLSEDTLGRIKEKSIVILQAGYEDESSFPTVFSGQIVSMVTEVSGSVDVVTRLHCNGIYLPKKNVRATLSYPPGLTYRQILEELINELSKYGISKGGLYYEPQIPFSNLPAEYSTRLNVKPSKGYAVRGFLINQLTELCSSLGFRVYFFNSKVYIEPEEYSPLLEVYRIEENTVLGAIKPSLNNSPQLGDKKKMGRSLTVEVPLDGRIRTDKKVFITYGDHKGFYDIEKLNVSLDYEGEDWKHKLNLTEVKGESKSS